jgi:dihydropteroate synthase
VLFRPRYLNVGGRLLDLDIPKVMGIVNVTPDSFYRGSRVYTEKGLIDTVGRMLSEGAEIVDVGGYSSRPGAMDVSYAEERERAIPAIRIISDSFPDAVISVDTFRADIAREAVEEAGAAIINDISAGDADRNMFRVVKQTNAPYIMMHMQGAPSTMQMNPVYDDIVADILKYFSSRIFTLREAGVKDIIVDPGFGFGKTINHNFELLHRLDEFTVTGLPLLVGLSRKSMVWKTLEISADEALNGTTVLNTVALFKGADIIRVHDVREAVQAVKLVSRLKT